MVVIRPLTKGDVNSVLGLTKQEDWKEYIPLDIVRYLECEPNGCFIAEDRRKPIGHVFSISYGKAGWIGLLIVHPDHRGRGVGTMLMITAINYLKRIGIETIRLEAVPEAVRLYQRLGFVEEFDSLRFCKELKPERVHAKSLRKEAFIVQKEDLKKLARFDSKYFGANRLKVLERLYRDYPKNCLAIREGRGIIGYTIGRKTLKGYWLGPWVCDPTRLDIARRLFLSCVGALDVKGELRLGMPAVNSSGIRLMMDLGFRQVSKSVRMVWGKHEYSGKPEGVFGIGGPEKG